MDLLPAVEVETGAMPTHSVICLHGLGANGHDFEPVVPELGLPPDLAVRFVFPHAPQIAVTINAGYVMPAWYDILSLDKVSRQVDLAGIEQSREQIHALIEREKSRGIPANHIVIAGFSQGGAMAYSVGLTYPERLAGIMALSAYIPSVDWLVEQRHLANYQIPIFVAHGLQDDVVGLSLGQQSVEWLTEHQYTVEWHTYPMAHQVCWPEIQQIGRWLTQRFQSPDKK
ncbi:MAG: alpha/beta hydrolase [Pseudomonadota bacterium]|nr:alpha/beta hydrolase [Pseudomonadota bacterium]